MNRTIFALLLACAACASSAHAAQYPVRPVRAVIGFPLGGSVDDLITKWAKVINAANLKQE